jgi:hypothetical protein
MIQMSRLKGALAPFVIRDMVIGLARNNYIPYHKIARSAFGRDIYWKGSEN